MYRYTVAVVFFILVQNCQTRGLKVFEVFACEQQTENITCIDIPGTTINIQSANYGRTSLDVCSNDSAWLTNCTSTNTTAIVRGICQGNVGCTLEADNDLLGDPCSGNSKYLEVQYDCINPSGWKVNYICELRTDDINCTDTPGTVINIQSADYGRTSLDVCYNDGAWLTNCTSSNTTAIVRGICQGNVGCTLEADNDLLGDPCSGNSKYLEVQYDCVDPSASTQLPESSTSIPTSTSPPHTDSVTPTTGLQAFICETETADISCSDTPCSIIYITSANYGRTSLDVCTDDNATLTNCIFPTSTHIVQETCQGNVTCTLEAGYSMFGDPCEGSSKYLEVQYDCISSPELCSTQTESLLSTVSLQSTPTSASSQQSMSAGSSVAASSATTETVSVNAITPSSILATTSTGTSTTDTSGASGVLIGLKPFTTVLFTVAVQVYLGLSMPLYLKAL